MMFSYEFYIDPVAKGRPRFTARGGFARAYTDAKTRTFENTLSMYAKVQHENRPILDGPLEISVVFYLKKPQSVKRKYPVIKPDLDNFIKAMCDSLNGIVWKDDSQIIKCIASKEYTAGESCIKLVVTQL